MSFEDDRNVLVVTYADDSLDDEEFLILHDFYEPVNPIYIHTGILIHSVWIHLIRASVKQRRSSDSTECSTNPCNFRMPSRNRLQWNGSALPNTETTLAKWISEFLGVPNYNNSGSKNLEIPRNSKFIANRAWNS